MVRDLGLASQTVQLPHREAIHTCNSCGAVIPNLEGIALSKMQRRVYLFIAKNPWCTVEQIITGVYHDDRNGGPVDARGCVATFIHHANKRLIGQAIVCRFSSDGSTYRIIKL